MGNTPKSRDLLEIDALEQAAECLRTVGHPHRLRMVQLMLNGRHTVGELAQSCSISPHMASEHLRLMKRCGLLQSERDGRKTYYSVCEPHLASIMSCVEDRFGGSQ